MDIFVEATKFVRNVANQLPLKNMIGECIGCGVTKRCRHSVLATVKELNPGPEVKTDDQLRGT